MRRDPRVGARMQDLTPTAVGTWSGGRFMRFGEPLDDERFAALLRPGDGIGTVITADAYGAGEADRLLGRALAGVPRDDYALVGAIGHDFYEGEREGAKGFPRFTDPRLRGPEGYADYVRMATERSLERCGVDAFDLLLLHNPDRTGYTSEAVWDALEARPRRRADARGSASRPGPANGFTLDLIDCFERFGDRIDWAMVILNPLEPWPGELVLPAAERHGVRADHARRRLRRAVPRRRAARPRVPASGTTARSGPQGWIERGRERLERMRPIAERHGLTPLQLACAWNLAHAPVRCVAPTLIQEPGAGRAADRGQARRAGRRRRAAAAERRGGRGDPRDRRQHGLDGAQGRRAGLRRRRRGRPLAAHGRPLRASPAAGASTPRATS